MRNTMSLPFLIFSCNRTFMELKYPPYKYAQQFVGCNRTFMELKSTIHLHIPEHTRSVFRDCSQQPEGLK